MVGLRQPQLAEVWRNRWETITCARAVSQRVPGQRSSLTALTRDEDGISNHIVQLVLRHFRPALLSFAGLYQHPSISQPKTLPESECFASEARMGRRHKL